MHIAILKPIYIYTAFYKFCLKSFRQISFNFGPAIAISDFFNQAEKIEGGEIE